HPMTNDDERGEVSWRLKGLEQVVKVGTIAVGTLYAFGLLISNLQLMALGVADFTSLQARNVVIGFMFAIYASLYGALIVCLLVPVFLVLWRLQGKKRALQQLPLSLVISVGLFTA